jgi:hypothetical protein
VLAKVSFTMSEKDPALRVTKAATIQWPLNWNLVRAGSEGRGESWKAGVNV